MMQNYLLIFCTVVFVISYVIENRKINPITLFFGEWMIMIFLNSLGLFSLYLDVIVFSPLTERKDTVIVLNPGRTFGAIEFAETLKNCGVVELPHIAEKAEKELSKLEAKKTAADQKAAEEAKKAEAESVVKKLIDSGMSVDEIIEKLK